VFQRRWKEVFEAIGLVAIIASLVFVGLQNRQDQAIARADLGSRTAEIQIGIKEILTRQDFAQVWAKMLRQPQDLTFVEKIQVEGFLRMTQESFFRECHLMAVGVFGECEGVVRGHVSLYFGSQYAKDWWKDNPMGGRSEWMNDVIENADIHPVPD
jgi:hypothetical protein